MPKPQINPNRLMQTMEALGRIGETPDGMQRIAFSPADLEGRRFVMQLMAEAGLRARVDPAANIIGRLEGSVDGLPAIAIGSHTDTVPSGGKYDGSLGVLGAIECVRALRESGVRLRHPVEVLDFTNEEGTRYRRWLYGSRAMAGKLLPEDLTALDPDGVPIGQRLKDVNGDLERIHLAKRASKEFCAYLELHIEQGPELHQSKAPVGVVTAITGRVALEVAVRGFANHAGTTPMKGRRDALVAASHVVRAVGAIASHQEVCRVGTVGMIKAHPGAENVIPGLVEMSVEFRDTEEAKLRLAEQVLRQTCRDIGLESDTEIEVHRIGMTQPKPMSDRVRDITKAAAKSLGFKFSDLPSGAGHDAQSMAELCDVGMIFVPSVDGISHSPHEYSTPEACANGASVLLQALLSADEAYK
jgi:N-carbamoyl-L-amino-acid hydrolase